MRLRPLLGPSGHRQPAHSFCVAAALFIGFVAPFGCAVPGKVTATSAEGQPDLGRPVLSFLWKHGVNDSRGKPLPQEFASPAIEVEQLDEAQLFLGSRGGELFALSAKNGDVRWRLKIGAVSSRPTREGNRLFVGTDDGHLVCVNTLDRKEVWRYKTRAAILHRPVLHERRVIFSNEANDVYALDKETGKLAWVHTGEDNEEFIVRGHAGAVVDGDYVYTGTSTGSLIALRASSGSVAWLTSLTADTKRFVDVDGTPVVDGDAIYITSSSAGVYSVDKTTGLIRWNYELRNAGPVTVDEERIYVAAAEVGIHALDKRGRLLWRQGTRGGGEPTDLQISGDYLLYTLTDKGLFIANKWTGELFQYWAPGMGISARPTLWGNRLFVLTNGGFLYAFSMR